MKPQQKHYEPKLYYDFHKLSKSHPDLAKFFNIDPVSKQSRFKFTTESTNLLFKYILLDEFDTDILELRTDHLCPVIPSRIQYLLNVKEVLVDSGLLRTESPNDESIRGIDIGTGYYGIYALLAYRLFKWSMVGTDIDDQALKNLDRILIKNGLTDAIKTCNSDLFNGVMIDGQKLIHFTMCNPPFYGSEEELKMAYQEKGFKSTDHDLVIGSDSELIYKGRSSIPGEGNIGELGFVQNMIDESYKLRDRIVWFSSIVSKNSNIKRLIDYLSQDGTPDPHKTTNFHVRKFVSGRENTEHWLLFWSYQGYRVEYPNEHFKGITSTSVHVKINLSHLGKILEPLKEFLEVEETHEDDTASVRAIKITGYDACWKRSFQRSLKQRHKKDLQPNQKVDRNKFVFVVKEDSICWKFGFDPSEFQSFQGYILQKLKLLKG